VLASEVLELLFPKVQNPNVYIQTHVLAWQVDWKGYLVLLIHCRQIQRWYLNLGQGHFFPPIHPVRFVVNNCIAWTPDFVVPQEMDIRRLIADPSVALLQRG